MTSQGPQWLYNGLIQEDGIRSHLKGEDGPVIRQSSVAPSREPSIICKMRMLRSVSVSDPFSSSVASYCCSCHDTVRKLSICTTLHL